MRLQDVTGIFSAIREPGRVLKTMDEFVVENLVSRQLLARKAKAFTTN